MLYKDDDGNFVTEHEKNADFQGRKAKKQFLDDPKNKSGKLDAGSADKARTLKYF